MWLHLTVCFHLAAWLQYANKLTYLNNDYAIFNYWMQLTTGRHVRSGLLLLRRGRRKSRFFKGYIPVCMYVCMYENICNGNAPLLQPKQSRVCARRPNRKDVSLACYRIVSMSMLDHEVTVVESSTVLEQKQQSCVVQNL